MKFEIVIDGKNTTLEYNGKMARLFRGVAGKDLLSEMSAASGRIQIQLNKLVKEVGAENVSEVINEETLQANAMTACGDEYLSKIVWAGLAAHNPKTKPYEKWFDGIDNYMSLIVQATGFHYFLMQGGSIVEPAEESTGNDKKK
jgi:hypothetical protein